MVIHFDNTHKKMFLAQANKKDACMLYFISVKMYEDFSEIFVRMHDNSSLCLFCLDPVI